MTAFLIAAALMLATALFFILPTLLRKQSASTVHVQRDALNLEVLRDQLRELNADREAGVIDAAGYENSRRELEQRVAEDVRPGTQTIVAQTGKPWTAIGLAILVPVVAAALYFTLGNRDGLDPSKVVAASSAENITPEQINGMVEKLARRLKDTPDDIEGWTMMARSYAALGRFKESADAYAHLTKLLPQDADMLADYADALAMANNRTMQGEPEKAILRALQLDPKNIKALALSAVADSERHDYTGAVAQWRKIMALAPPDSDLARSVGSNINEALALAGTPAANGATGTSGASDTAKANAAPPAAAGAQVSGSVELDPALRSQVSDTDTVFIFARAVDGPRFPLAVLRKQVKDLPTTFTLDDSMAMMPNAKLSDFPQVMVGARISKSGSATPGVGDLEGITEPLKPGAKNVKIRINSQHK
ncbi:MAG: c-type cytochrome biogenesis protein CcmI [Burkholderiaceae bacterium]|nr:c-type cytochrome biogenesis protein CcmI [Burkholderiaceae bacterium]